MKLYTVALLALALSSLCVAPSAATADEVLVQPAVSDGLGVGSVVAPAVTTQTPVTTVGYRRGYYRPYYAYRPYVAYRPYYGAYYRPYRAYRPYYYGYRPYYRPYAYGAYYGGYYGPGYYW